MAQYVAAVHQGTTDTHFMVFDRGGRVVASMHKEHDPICPQSGWVEHDPMEIWKCTQDVIKGALQKSGVKAEEIAAIGVTNQRETTVVWNKNTGKPYHNAIVWQDARTKGICDDLAKDGGQDRFRPKVGLPLATYFSGPKIKWILDNVEGVRAAARRGDALFGNMDTWEIWWLTGGPNGGAHVTDVTNASRTMLMDLKTLDWDREILGVMDIPRQMLPEIRPSSDPRVYGYTSRNGPLGTRIPVCGDLGDQQAHLFGQTCYCEGEAKSTYYSMGDCLMLFNTGSKPFPSKCGLLTTVAYGRPEGTTYALEGSFTFGAAVQWLCDGLRLVQSAAKAEEIARSVKDAGGIYFVPAFSGLSAPHWDRDARGLISGLTRDVTRAHVVRAALESICYQTRDILEVMQAESGIAWTTVLKVNGDATANDLLMQLQANIVGVPVVRPKVQETATLGAAYAAGLATGLWSGLKELQASRTEDRVFYPQGDRRRHEFAYVGWSEAVERSKPAMTRKKPEREFEDRVIVPLLRAWGFQYEGQCPVQVGKKKFVADFCVSDEQGRPRTVFENKAEIPSNKPPQSDVDQAKLYAIQLRLPSFVVASPEGMWLYSLDGNKEKLEKKFSTAAMKDLNQEDEFNEFKRLLSSLRK